MLVDLWITLMTLGSIVILGAIGLFSGYLFLRLIYKQEKIMEIWENITRKIF